MLLLTDGLESTALAAWRRPRLNLTIDYGQGPAAAELTAGSAVCRELGLEHHVLRVDCGHLGAGLLAQREHTSLAPSPEWWPYRNQLLVTLAAAWGIGRGVTSITVGSVREDGRRHRDGSPEFYGTLDRLLALQEGQLRVDAPATAMSSEELLKRSAVSDEVLGWTHSCHLSDIACGACPGCYKRREILVRLRRLR